MYPHKRRNKRMNQKQAVRLEAYLRQWRIAFPYRWQQGADLVASELMSDLEFTDIKIASLLESPAGVTVTQVVERALPFPASAEVAVMVKAIEIAARQRTN